ncbi:MAG: methyl-accepting chemotaxis protein [Thalassolituus sp.]|uniref:methyl-accepting chemotaxis protein n=1 Tax=Thalassolituus sp. TaxID=2030822 RepID=UPI003982B2B2
MDKAKITISQRLLLTFSAVFLVVAAYLFFEVLQYRDDMLREKKIELSQLIDAQSSQIQAVIRSAQGMSNREAKTQAANLVRQVRYDQKQYFFIIDEDLNMVVHPYQPVLEGQSMLEAKDSRQRELFQRMKTEAFKDRVGYLEYEWPKPGSDISVLKLTAVTKVSGTDWIVGTGVYIDELDAAVNQRFIRAGILLTAWGFVMWLLGHYFVTSIQRPLARIAQNLTGMTQGDLSTECPTSSTAEMAILAEGINSMRKRTQSLIAAVQDNSRDLTRSTGKLKTSMLIVSDGSERQHKELDRIAESMTMMVDTIFLMAGHARDAADDMQSASQHACEGETIMDQARNRVFSLLDQLETSAAAITELNSSAAQIASVAEVIASISEQTNLLALNAAIEAARAGESGRGFAVVADEVRTLAQRTGVATDEIKQVIEVITNGSKAAVDAMEQSAEETKACAEDVDHAQQQLALISTAMTKVKDLNLQLAAGITQQEQVAREMNNNLGEVTRAADEHQVTARHLDKACNALTELSDSLEQQLTQFRTDTDIRAAI